MYPRKPPLQPHEKEPKVKRPTNDEINWDEQLTRLRKMLREIYRR